MLFRSRAGDELAAYPEAFQQSWLFEELWKARNFKQWMAKGLYMGSLMVGIEQFALGGKFPWTLHHQHADHEMLEDASQHQPIQYPKPDGKISFDRLSSVFLDQGMSYWPMPGREEGFYRAVRKLLAQPGALYPKDLAGIDDEFRAQAARGLTPPAGPVRRSRAAWRRRHPSPT